MGWWSFVKTSVISLASATVTGTFGLVAAKVILLVSWPFAIIMATVIVTIIVVALADYYLFSDDKEADLPDLPNTALSGDFPYHASIHLNGEHICSAAFIGTYFILTVAHCVHRFVNNQIEKSKLQVFVGVREVPVDTGYGYKVDKITTHPNFEVHRLVYNVAVLKMTEKITKPSRSFPVILPSPRMEIERTTVNISGFRTLEPGVLVDMTKSNMIIIEYKTCHSHFINKIQTSGKFCVIPSRRWKPCQTSRGGLATNADDVLIGLYVMQNPKGCAKDLPEILVDVKRFLDFIRGETDRETD